ncbi:hypothetical protein F4556_004731 [Kitasatospora gansuensis]|uniref:Uncharacterized protein n=1 Tax=Kitasatospora gansuensis TaxID=258050 RepID=A0A7W7SH17_9ACTN|nr:hypothetical protein [Kitasatospora gansuensis]
MLLLSGRVARLVSGGMPGLLPGLISEGWGGGVALVLM